jgi:hypothetical protein
MTRSWTAFAVALLALGLAAGCNNYNNSVQYATGATLTNISPTGVPAGSAGITLTLTASALNGFTNKTVVQWNGQNLVTTFLDTVTVTAAVPANLLNKPATAYVNVYAPQSGTGQNGLSNSLAFYVVGPPNPQPTITSVSPDTAPTCGTSCTNASLNITVAGTNFLPFSNNGGSVVSYTGLGTNGKATALSISSFSATQLKATIPGSYLSSPDPNAVIVVINPLVIPCLTNCPYPVGKDGGTSNAVSFTVTATAAAAAQAAAEETPAVSQDGRYVAYSSQQNGAMQILLRDTCLGAQNGCTPDTKVISAGLDGAAGNGDSHTPAMSVDGRYVAFSSAATNLLENAPSGRQVYLRDTCIGAPASCKPSTVLISTDPEGALVGTESIFPSISSSGRFVAFLAITPSNDSNKAKTPANSPNSGLRQVFIRDTCLGAANCTPKTTRISLQPGDAPADSNKPAGPALSGLAKQVALVDGKNTTVFTSTVPVDDRFFVAATNSPK